MHAPLASTREKRRTNLAAVRSPGLIEDKTRAQSPGLPLFLQAKLDVTQSRPNHSGLLLQRKCACGSSASSLSKECPECGSRKRPDLRAKLKIGGPGDVYEQEADRIADQVLAKPAHSDVIRAPPRIQCYTGQAIGQGNTVPASVDYVLAGSGRPLEPALRQDMEQRFGHDFSRVRVHSGVAAEQSAREVNAHAYTVGHNIVFGADRFAPGTREGRRLIAHELTHVVQQSGAVAGPPTMLARQPAKAHMDAANEWARELAKKLHQGKRDEVLGEIEKLAEVDRKLLDTAAGQLPAKDHPEPLRRAIRFVRNKPAAAPNKTVVTVVDAGTSEPGAMAEKVAAGGVEFRRGVSYKSAAGDSKEAYSLTYRGTDAAEMRWLQFIWRELVREFPPAAKGGRPRKVPVRKRLDFGSNVYHLTTNLARPSWSTDSPSAGSAFYEEHANRSADELTMFDAPSSMQSDAAASLTGAAGDPDRVVSHFHATIYLIRGMDVLYRVEIDITWEFTKETLKTAGGPPAQVTAKKGKAGSIEPAHRARLAYQYPVVDYLPGSAIGAPQPVDAFDPIPDIAPAGSITEKDWPSKGDLEKYEDVAALAHAEWIDDVTGKSSTTINQASGTKALGPSGVKPGLNYWANLAPEEGQTGFIDAKGNYHNPDFPTDADGPLPRVAIILGPEAFKRDKMFALATIRHEMQHAAHNQLAIGWLLKWRDERSGTPFKEWLSKEKTKKRISGVDFALVSTGVDLDLSATELLAWAEGFVTALPFLPAKPEFRLMASGDYPAAISALKGAGKFYNAPGSSAVKQAALDRIRGAYCETLNQSQRDALKNWIPFLLDPSSHNPATTDESTVTLMKNDFQPLKAFLEQVLASVKKACPK